jgi:shikimate dehydrogenase
VALLGAGGTARAAVAAMAQLGVGTVSIHVRAPERATSVSELARSLGLQVSISGLSDVPPGVPVVSTLPASGAGLLTVNGPLVDVVYAPWPTPLAVGAERAGYPVIGGLVVLVGQAVRQVELMTGARSDPAMIAAMRAAGESALDTRD